MCPKITTPPVVDDVGEGLIGCSAISDAAPMPTEEHEDDVHRFGVSIAESPKAERTAPFHAQTELMQASAKAAASCKTLAAVYGPDVAAGREDPVVELSVLGPRATARFTTLPTVSRPAPNPPSPEGSTQTGQKAKTTCTVDR